MNKNRVFGIVLSLFVSVIALTSCGNKTSKYIDENGCFFDLDAALTNAQSKKQNMFIVFTRQGDDAFSDFFVNQIVKSESFKTEILTAYTVVLMDFSDATYQDIVNDSKNSTKSTEERAYQLQKNATFADMLHMEYSPAFYLMTQDEYYVGEVTIPYTVKTAEEVLVILEKMNPMVEEIQSLANRAKTGSTLDRVAAIDELYEKTNPDYRTFLADLIETVIKIDSKNESGLLGKYLLEDAKNSALACFYVGDIQGAVNSYINLCSNPLINPEEKQQAYYMSAYLLSYTGSDDLNQIVQYLQYAIQAYPEGELVPAIQQAIEYMASNYEEGAAQ